MNLTHLHDFVNAMKRKDIDAMLPNMSESVTLKTPLVAQPFQGKAAIRPVVEALFKVVDTFDLREILQGPTHVAQFFGITAGSEVLDGMDYFRLDDDGYIVEMTVLWRPLPAIAAVQAHLDRLAS